jgi:predicted  nucleic acid-binding Zn-ribbon protein
MEPLEIVGAAIASGVAGFFAYLRTRKGKTAAWNWAKRLFNVDPSADDLRSSVDNMTLVVDAQGQSISYLTEQQEFLLLQLTTYREELAAAQEQLKELESLHKENTNLKRRIVELESQVAKLEAELERRRKFTPKAKRVDVDDQE